MILQCSRSTSSVFWKRGIGLLAVSEMLQGPIRWLNGLLHQNQEHKPLWIVLVILVEMWPKYLSTAEAEKLLEALGVTANVLPSTGVVCFQHSWKCWGWVARGGLGHTKGVLQFLLFYSFIFLLWKNHHEDSDKGSQNYLTCRGRVWGVRFKCELWFVGCFWLNQGSQLYMSSSYFWLGKKKDKKNFLWKL